MHGYTLEALWVLDSIWVCTEGPMGIHMMPYGYVALETLCNLATGSQTVGSRYLGYETKLYRTMMSHSL